MTRVSSETSCRATFSLSKLDPLYSAEATCELNVCSIAVMRQSCQMQAITRPVGVLRGR